MAATIYYLSAAGNSLYAAKKIAEKLSITEKTTLQSMPDALARKNLSPKGTVGFVMPLHFFTLPLFANEFLNKIDLSKAEYTFAVITCGFHYISDAFGQLAKLIDDRNGRLDASFYVDMISIYLPLNDIPPVAKTINRLSEADKKLSAISGKIITHSDNKAGEPLSLIAKLLYTLTNRQPEKLDKNFTADKGCTKCNLCVRICPKQNIRLENGSPKWLHNCTQCLACLHICPEEIIELGSRTRGRRRYRHPQIKVTELLRS